MKWFKHDSDANMDMKLQEVLLDYGLEGYGLYWYCIELIAGKIDQYNLTFELEHDARIIARNTGSTAQKVEEMMRKFVQIGLFEVANGSRITCLKLAKRLDQSMTSNTALRKAFSELTHQGHDEVMTESCKKRREEKRIDKKRKHTGRFTPPSAREVQEYLNEKGISDFSGDEFCDHYTAVNWHRGKTKIKSWKHCVSTWVKTREKTVKPKYGEGAI